MLKKKNPSEAPQDKPLLVPVAAGPTPPVPVSADPALAIQTTCRFHAVPCWLTPVGHAHAPLCGCMLPFSLPPLSTCCFPSLKTLLKHHLRL